MAYKKLIVHSCDFGGCKTRASWGVFNTWNALYGYYCARHADQKVAELTRKEQGDGEEKEKA